MHILKKITVICLLVVPNFAGAFLEKPELKKIPIYKLSSSLSKMILEEDINSLPLRNKLEMAEIFLDTDKTYQALKTLEAIEENNLKIPLDQCRYYASQARAYYSRNNIEKAITAAEKLVDIASKKCKPQLASAHAVLFLLFPQKKEYEKSMEQYIAFLNSAVIVGLSDNAMNSFKGIEKQMKKKKKKDAAWYVTMAKLYGRDDDTEKQLMYLTKALEKDNEYIPALASMASIYNDLERYEDALEYYKKIIGIDPYYFRAQNGAGSATYEIARHSNEGDTLKAYENAIQYLQRAIELDPEYPRPNNTLGLIYYFVGQKDKAEDYIKRAIAYTDYIMIEDPTYARPMGNLARIYFDTKNYESAVEYYEKALEKSPNDPLAYFWLADLGTIYRIQKKYTKALSTSLKALDLIPESVDVRLLISQIFVDLKTYDSAIEVLQEGLELAPEELRYYKAISTVYTLQGKTKEADEWLKKFKDLSENK